MTTDSPIITRADAKATGKKRFFTGDQCANGHISERYTSGGQCCECLRLAFLTYRAANLEREMLRRHDYYARTKEHEQQRYADNRDAILSKQHDRYKANRDQIRSAVRARRQRSIDLSRQKDRQARSKGGERLREYKNAWERQHPDIRRAKKRRRRARVKGAIGHHSIQDIKRIYKLQRGRCAMCQTSLRHRYDVDHINPLSRGGGDNPCNLQLLCRPCNSSKRDRDPLDHARQTGRLL